MLLKTGSMRSASQLKRK